MVVAIGKIVKNGIIFDVKNWDKKLMDIDNLFSNIEILFNTLEERQINYLLVGGIALLSYVEGRNTQGIDLIVSRQDLAILSEISIADENKDFIRGNFNFNQLQIDILLTQNKLFNYVLHNFATKRKFAEKEICCVTVEGLIILKLYALPSLYHQGKFERASLYENDILLLLLNYSVNLSPILKLLKKHLISSDWEEIKDILTEIKAKIKRFSRHQKS